MPNEEPHMKILSQHKEIYDRYMVCGEIVNLFPHIKNDIVNAYKFYHPQYEFNSHCASCVADMLVTVYKFYEEAHKNIL